METVELTIVIISYNTRELLRKCLKSIFAYSSEVNYEIIIVDNASSDDSVEMVKNDFPYIFVIKNSENVGFARANNQGIHFSRGKYILLLNSDTEVSEGCIKTVYDFCEKTIDVGIVGCKTRLVNGGEQLSCYRFPTLLSEFIFFTKTILKDVWDPITYYQKMQYWKRNSIKNVDCVSGCFFWMCRSVVEKIGKLDEKIFMYYEDTEYCLRLRRMTDMKTYFIPDAQIMHYHGAGTNKEQEKSKICGGYNQSLYYLSKRYNNEMFITWYKQLIRLVWHIEVFFLSVFIHHRPFKEKYDLLNYLLKNTKESV